MSDQPSASDETPRKSLWDVMSKSEPADSDTPEADDAATEDSEPAARTEAEGKFDPAATSDPTGQSQPVEHSTTTPARSLWQVMGDPSGQETHSDSDDDVAGELVRPDESEVEVSSSEERAGNETADEPPAPNDNDAPALAENAAILPDDFAVLESIAEARPLDRRRNTTRRSHAGPALALGILAVCLSTLAARPEFVLRVPAPIVGLAAVALGWSSVQSARRLRMAVVAPPEEPVHRDSGSVQGSSASTVDDETSDDLEHTGADSASDPHVATNPSVPVSRIPGMAVGALAMLCGVAAVCLGPFVFQPQGELERRSRGRDETRSHLILVGIGLQEYHGLSGRFPSGGTYRTNQSSGEVPMHGWMTFLLPHVDQVALYESIDLDRPFNADVNREAMATDVAVYFASGSDRGKSQRGYSVSHFAGVGGEIRQAGVGLARAGVFGRNSRVRYDDVVDGLSQTLVAGEVGAGFSAWGAPDNWRTPNGGLNERYDGFGNADRTGAMFLMADGSVRFLPNETPPDILQKLATRDAGEPAE